MTFEQRLAAIRARLEATQFDCVIALHDGAHFIEKPDPVMVLTGFKALGPVAAVFDRAGAVSLVVTPSWDAERAGELCPGIKIVPADDVIAGLETSHRPRPSAAYRRIAGLGALPYGIARRFTALVPQAQARPTPSSSSRRGAKPRPSLPMRARRPASPNLAISIFLISRGPA